VSSARDIKVRYLIVGAEAVIYHGFARLTGGIDIFFEPSPGSGKKEQVILASLERASVSFSPCR
jgi:hypothetical protein